MQNKSGSLENCVCWIEFPPSNILKSHDDIENLPRNVDDDDPAHWDHALLLTGLDLYDRYKTQDAVIGLAWVSGMCPPVARGTSQKAPMSTLCVLAHVTLPLTLA